MIHNLISNHDIVDKASHLREGNILNHEDLCIDKIKLIIIWENKFSVTKINESSYEAIWHSGQKAYDLMLKSETLIFSLLGLNPLLVGMNLKYISLSFSKVL